MNNREDKIILQKLAFFLFFFIYYNICFLIFTIKMYTVLIYQIYIIIYFLTLFLDTMLRPIAHKDEKFDKYSLIILILFILAPFMLILSYIENMFFIATYVSIWNSINISYIGIIIYIIAVITLLTSRINLGRFATGDLVIEDNHKLITSGIYKYIRHPIYLGTLLGVLGFGLVYRALFVPILCFIMYFLVFRQRMIYEEKILENEFGGEYTAYKKGTKKLIPFLY